MVQEWPALEALEAHPSVLPGSVHPAVGASTSRGWSRSAGGPRLSVGMWTRSTSRRMCPAVADAGSPCRVRKVDRWSSVRARGMGSLVASLGPNALIEAMKIVECSPGNWVANAASAWARFAKTTDREKIVGRVRSLVASVELDALIQGMEIGEDPSDGRVVHATHRQRPPPRPFDGMNRGMTGPPDTASKAAIPCGRWVPPGGLEPPRTV